MWRFRYHWQTHKRTQTQLASCKRLIMQTNKQTNKQPEEERERERGEQRDVSHYNWSPLAEAVRRIQRVVDKANSINENAELQ